MQLPINDRQNTEIKSNHYSLKLLTTLATTDFLANKQFKNINNLQTLSNRLKAANQTHKHKNNAILSTKEWMNEEGINFNNTFSLVEKARKQQRIPKPRSAGISWSTIQFQSMKQLSFDEYVHQNEERLAYLSVMQALSNRSHRTTNKHMKNIRKKVLNKLNKCSDNKKVDNSQSGLMDQVTLKNTLGCIIEQGLDIDKEQVLKYLHNRMAKFLKGSHTHWIQLLSSQIEMVNFLQQNGLQLLLVSNFIYILSFKFLQKLYQKQFKNRRMNRQDFLTSRYQKSVLKDKRYWADIFFYLRTGQIQKCVLLLSENGQYELAKDIQTFSEQLNQFKILEVDYQVEINPKNTLFERIIKLVIKGQYEALFKQLSTEKQLLDDPWFILATILIKRKNAAHSQGAQDVAILQYFTQNLSSRSTNQYLSLLVGLLSLGRYDLIIQLFKNKQRSQPYYEQFIHVFILLASNPNLLIAMQHSTLKYRYKQAHSLLDTCLQQLTHYVKLLLQKYSPHFSNYLRLLLQILSNLAHHQSGYNLRPTLKNICRDLFPNVSTLRWLNSSKLSNQQRQIISSDIFFNQLLLNITYRQDSQYFQLADFCDTHNRSDIQQHILLSFLIKTEIQQDLKQRDTIKNGTFEATKDQSQKTKNLQLALQTLQNIQVNNIQIIQFIIELRGIRKLLRERRKTEITTKIKKLQTFRGDQVVLKYLEDMGRRDGRNYFDVFLSYYGKLYRAYQIYYVALSKISAIKQLRQQLASELRGLRSNYNSFNTNLYGQIMATLLK